MTLSVMRKVSINLLKETRASYNRVKLMGIHNDGIIFGGMVRDEIVATHYKSLFDEYCENKSIMNYKKFWVKSFHPETAKRTIVPCDMDIYFQDAGKAETFITELDAYAKSMNGSIRTSNRMLYDIDDYLIHKKVVMRIVIGRTVTYSGITINLNYDIIINTSQNIIEPPFNNGDFTCNLFVMSKTIDNNYEIRLSKNTGTKLDKMSFVRKVHLESKLLNDLISGSTEFIRTASTPDAEYMNGLRILKMIEKDIKISNLLFREVASPSIECVCDICQMTIRPDDKNEPFIELLTNKHAVNIMHKKCFLNYLRNEIYKKNRNAETAKIECRCTRRNLFNFNNSYKYSSVF